MNPSSYDPDEEGLELPRSKSRYAAYFLWLEERAHARWVPFDASTAFRRHVQLEAREKRMFWQMYRRVSLGVLGAVCGLSAVTTACREMPPGHSWSSEAALLAFAVILHVPVISYGIALMFTPILTRRIDIDGDDGPGHETETPNEPPGGGQRHPTPAPVHAGSW